MSKIDHLIRCDVQVCNHDLTHIFHTRLLRDLIALSILIIILSAVILHWYDPAAMRVP